MRFIDDEEAFDDDDFIISENEARIKENEPENEEILEENEENPEKEDLETEIDVNAEVLSDEENDSENSYLDMARRIQADFDNYRRHATENIKKAKIDGQASVIEVFLPCLDTFKEAKKSITDENVLKGVEMIENKINDALKSLGVEKIESIGQIYNPHVHESLAIMRDESKEDDIILDEYQAGYKFNDKVLRYAKVIVNKLN